jgi:hypothetical protein
MEGEIGDAAGMIWQYLNEHGQTTLDRLRQGTKLSDQLLLMGVGRRADCRSVAETFAGLPPVKRLFTDAVSPATAACGTP